MLQLTVFGQCPLLMHLLILLGPLFSISVPILQAEGSYLKLAGDHKYLQQDSTLFFFRGVGAGRFFTAVSMLGVSGVLAALLGERDHSRAQCLLLLSFNSLFLLFALPILWHVVLTI